MTDIEQEARALAEEARNTMRRQEWMPAALAIRMADALDAMASRPASPATREAVARRVAEADEATLDYERRRPDYYNDPWEGYLAHADALLAAFTITGGSDRG